MLLGIHAPKALNPALHNQVHLESLSQLVVEEPPSLALLFFDSC